jgi:hypothetical protein
MTFKRLPYSRAYGKHRPDYHQLRGRPDRVAEKRSGPKSNPVIPSMTLQMSASEHGEIYDTIWDLECMCRKVGSIKVKEMEVLQLYVRMSGQEG